MSDELNKKVVELYRKSGLKPEEIVKSLCALCCTAILSMGKNGVKVTSDKYVVEIDIYEHKGDKQ